MYIIELAGRFDRLQGAACLVHNEKIKLPYIFNTVREAVNYIKAVSKIPIYLDRIRTINTNNDEIYVYKFSDDGGDVAKEINIIPCCVYKKES